VKGRRKKIQTFLLSYLPAIVEDGPSEKDSSEGRQGAAVDSSVKKKRQA